MSVYLWIKLVHIISATILFGTGLGTAFFMSKAHLSRNREVMVVTLRHVVLADWVFTTPAVAIQLASGLWLTHQLGIPIGSLWFVLVACLFAFVGACWIPVVWMQIRIGRIIAGGGDRDDYRRLMSLWTVLGVLAFGGVLLLFFLMVFRIGTDQLLFG